MRKTVLICGLALAIAAPSPPALADKKPERSPDQHQPGEKLSPQEYCRFLQEEREHLEKKGEADREIAAKVLGGIFMGFQDSNERYAKKHCQ
jgi:hypothetical protein